MTGNNETETESTISQKDVVFLLNQCSCYCYGKLIFYIFGYSSDVHFYGSDICIIME